MLTMFTTAKDFAGHSAVIQRNALKSWTLLHPDIEVLLFGDDAGASDIARELGIRHIAEVERLAQGPKLLPSFFDAAQRIARHNILCYANCDIIFLPDFLGAVASLSSSLHEFLMIGRRWDTGIAVPLPFECEHWQRELRRQALEANQQCGPTWIDFFVFPRGFYLGKLPPFVIGRIVWDHWLVGRARDAGLPVVDASDAVVAVHQNHDYSYHPGGRHGVWTDALAMRNETLAGSLWNLCTIDDATHLLGPSGLRSNPRRYSQAMRRFARILWQTTRLAALNRTRRLRHALGLRKRSVRLFHSPQSPAIAKSPGPSGDARFSVVK